MAMRVFTSLMAVWFGFITIQPLYGAPCPHHQPALAELAHGLGQYSAASQGKMAASGHHMHHSPGDSGSGSEDPCRCLGACTDSAPVALTQAAVELIPAILAECTSVPAVAANQSASQPAAPHTLPFATAPPRLLLA